MGGVAGHAGLFANAADVDALAGRLLALLPRRGRLRARRRSCASSGRGTRPCRTRPGRSAGTRRRRARRARARACRAHAVGHLGFTGHVALDRPRARRARDRCSPTACTRERDNERIREVRPRIHDAVMEVARRREGPPHRRLRRRHERARGPAARGGPRGHAARTRTSIRRRARCSRSSACRSARATIRRASTASTSSSAATPSGGRTSRRSAARGERACACVSFPAALAELFLAGRDAAGGRRHARQDHVVARCSPGCCARTGRDPGLPRRRRAARARRAASRSAPGPWFVVEGDEYDSAYFDKGPKFLHYRPAMLLLTAVEFDHADIYRDLDAREERVPEAARHPAGRARRSSRAATSRICSTSSSGARARVAALRPRRRERVARHRPRRRRQYALHRAPAATAPSAR